MAKELEKNREKYLKIENLIWTACKTLGNIILEDIVDHLKKSLQYQVVEELEAKVKLLGKVEELKIQLRKKEEKAQISKKKANEFAEIVRKIQE